MAYEVINPSELQAGKPVTANLMARIVNNIDDVNSRAEGTETETVTTNNTLDVRSSTLLQFGNTAGGNITTTLPPAGDMVNRTLIFKKISSDSNTFTIDGAGSDLIEGQLSQILTTQNQTLYLVSDGTSWWKIADIDASGAVSASRAINTTAPLTGGGNFTTDRTLSLVLADGQIYVGNASNVPVARAVTGDITISNTGVVSIASGAIVNADVNASAAIDISKISINGNIVPTTNNSRDLGSDAAEFKDLWIHNLKHGDSSNPNLVISTTSDNGNIQLTPHGTGKTVISNLQIPSGAGANYLLQSDASGNATWVPPPSGTSLAGLVDVTLGTPATDEVLIYNGSKWVDGTINTNSITNLAVTAAKIADLTITNGKIANSTIALTKLASTSAYRFIVAGNDGSIVAHSAITGNRILATDGNGLPTANAALTGSRLVSTDAGGLLTTIASITASRLLVSDSSGYPTASLVTAAEALHLAGCTGNIQGQFNLVDTALDTKITHAGYQAASSWTDISRPGGATNQVISGLTLVPADGDLFFMQISIRVYITGGTNGSISYRTFQIARNPYTNALTVTQIAATGMSQLTDTTASSITLAGSSDRYVTYTMPATTNHQQTVFEWRLWSALL